MTGETTAKKIYTVRARLNIFIFYATHIFFFLFFFLWRLLFIFYNDYNFCLRCDSCFLYSSFCRCLKLCHHFAVATFFSTIYYFILYSLCPEKICLHFETQRTRGKGKFQAELFSSSPPSLRIFLRVSEWEIGKWD